MRKLTAFLLLMLSPPLWAQNVYIPASQFRPTLTLTTATKDTTPFSTVNANAMLVQFKFGTVTGTYTTCTAQAYTAYGSGNQPDVTWLTLGSATTLTVTTGTVNAWTILAQAPTTTVTTSAVSATVALGFGTQTKFTIACSGAYGTSAPVTISVLTRP